MAYSNSGISENTNDIKYNNWKERISNDNEFTADIKRRAKELEDRIGSHYTKGCEISELPKEIEPK